MFFFLLFLQLADDEALIIFLQTSLFLVSQYALDNCMPLSSKSSLTLYCIALYLYIYIALLAVQTNQKRFQCERPREKSAVLRERKEALGSPVNKVDRAELKAKGQ